MGSMETPHPARVTGKISDPKDGWKLFIQTTYIYRVLLTCQALL